MKTPDEIKKGLDCNNIDHCNECPYDGLDCAKHVDQDALAYIQQLEAENADLKSRLAQVERERDAALHDFLCDPCEVCKHGETALDDCCALYTQCKFEWRGVCSENTKEE